MITVVVTVVMTLGVGIVFGIEPLSLAVSGRHGPGGLVDFGDIDVSIGRGRCDQGQGDQQHGHKCQRKSCGSDSHHSRPEAERE